MKTTVNYPRELVDRYMAFYRAKRKQGGINFSAKACTKPVSIALQILLRPDNSKMSPEELKDAISAQILVLMRAVHSGGAEGRWLLFEDAEREAIKEFVRFFIDEYFLKGCFGYRDRLAGNKGALLEHTCEFLYRESESESGKT